LLADTAIAAAAAAAAIAAAVVAAVPAAVAAAVDAELAAEPEADELEADELVSAANEGAVALNATNNANAIFFIVNP
jgi:hypothetical protein